MLSLLRTTLTTHRGLAALVLGVISALGAAHGCRVLDGVLGRWRPDWKVRPVSYWASDRDGHQLVGLDDELFVRTTIPMEYPTELAARSGGVWVARAVDGDPLGAFEVLGINAGGTTEVRVEARSVVDLEELDGGDGLLVERSPSGWNPVTRLTFAGEWQPLAAIAGASCVAGSGQQVLVGTEVGTLILLDARSGDAAPRAELALGGEFGDLARGPRNGEFWALDVVGRLFLLEVGAQQVRVVWSMTLGLSALHVLPVTGEEQVWLADTTEPLARRIGAHGEVELTLDRVVLSGLDRGAATADGGVVLCAPGALLRFGATGEDLPGQGGFDFLVDVVRVR